MSTKIVTTIIGPLPGSILSGSQDGVGSTVRFNAPAQMARDTTGNLYIADTQNNKIRKVVVKVEVDTVSSSSALSTLPISIIAVICAAAGILVNHAQK